MAGLWLLPDIASASTPVNPTAYVDPGSKVENVFPGQGDQLAALVDMEISNDFTAGDTITLPIEVGSTPTPNSGAVDQAVSFSSVPPAGAGTASASQSPLDTFPSFSRALTTNPADSGAVKAAGVQDELVLTFTDSASGPPTDNWIVTVGTIEYDLGAAAGGSANDVPVSLAPSYTSGPLSEGFSGSPVTNAYIDHYAVSQTPVGVSAGTPNVALNAFGLTEGTPGVLQPGPYRMSASTGSVTGTATVTATNVTVAPYGNGGCPGSGGGSTAQLADESGSYYFCVMTTSSDSTGPGGLTVTGISLVLPANAGPVGIALENIVNLNTFFGAQPAATVIANPRVAGQTADATAEVAAVSLYGGQQMNGGDGGAVIIASDATYQDALAASFLGFAPLPYDSVSSGTAQMNGPVPILLNPPTPPSGGESSSSAVAAIRALGATTVYIVGGTSAISPDVAGELSQIIVGYNADGSPLYLQVGRIAGYSAEQTAADIAELATGADITLTATPGAYGRYNSGASESPSGPSSGDVPTAILADASEFQDALAASPLAYGATVPVLLNPPGDALDSDTSQAITDLGVEQVLVVGGTFAVSDQVVAALMAKGVSVLRIAGDTYEQTAAELARFELNDYTAPSSGATQTVEGLDSPADVGSSPSITVGTSRGDAFQDALSSAQILGGASSYVSPLLLTDGPNSLSTPTADFLSSFGTGPFGGLTVYTDSNGASTVQHILGDVIFGGVYAQTAGLTQSELDDIADG